MTQRENPNTQSMTSIHSSCFCFGLGSCKHLLLRPLDLTIKPAWIMRDVARAAMLSKRFMFCKSTGKKEGNYFSKGKMLIMYVFSKGIVLVEWPSLKSKVQKNQEGLLMSITFYCGVLIHCPFLMIVLWKRTMPGYQSPSAKQSTQKIAISKLNSLQHYLSLSTGYTIAASSK